jgi:hypothetical protein
MKRTGVSMIAYERVLKKIAKITSYIRELLINCGFDYDVVDAASSAAWFETNLASLRIVQLANHLQVLSLNKDHLEL